ncbi:bacteriohemerythrin [Methanoculleus thermophilus]|jgi:hemerythrin|nr:bacteriohemerythrin [Methanoculleus thermophilus]NLN08574.1 bacteriohemerythrin [Methanoculleus thermophilus]HQD27341.1 bacteriohemerythrin [Methanoculleus thermophilus]
MAFMKWTDDLSVGVREIDDQHQKLVSLINDLHDAMRDKRGKDVLGKVLTDLAAYTEYHFSTEEKYMQKFGYAEFDAHRSEHQAFVAKVGEFKKGFDEGKLGLSIQVMSFLRDWVANHIKGSDKRYTDFFREHGLS